MRMLRTGNWYGTRCQTSLPEPPAQWSRVTRDPEIGGRLRVRVLSNEHAHKVWRPTFFEVRVLRTERS